jgi:hypothetical protein
MEDLVGTYYIVYKDREDGRVLATCLNNNVVVCSPNRERAEYEIFRSMAILKAAYTYRLKGQKPDPFRGKIEGFVVTYNLDDPKIKSVLNSKFEVIGKEITEARSNV